VAWRTAGATVGSPVSLTSRHSTPSRLLFEHGYAPRRCPRNHSMIWSGCARRRGSSTGSSHASQVEGEAGGRDWSKDMDRGHSARPDRPRSHQPVVAAHAGREAHPHRQLANARGLDSHRPAADGAGAHADSEPWWQAAQCGEPVRRRRKRNDRHRGVALRGVPRCVRIVQLIEG
jgi:hypothetical protein